MKFILNENAKFVLEERFSLNEASAADVAKTWTAKLNEYLTNADLVFKAYLQIIKDESKKPKTTADAEKDISRRGNAGKEVKTAIEDIEDSLELPADQLKGEDGQFSQIKSEVKHCHDTIQDAISTLTLKNNLKNLVTAQLKILADLSPKTKWTTEDITDLKEVLEWFSTNILPHFNTTDQAKTIETDKTKLQKFIDTCNKGLEIIENIQDDLQEFNFDGGSNEDLRTYRELVKSLVTDPDLQLQPAARINALSNDKKQAFIDKIDNQQKHVEDITGHLLKISKTSLLASTKDVVDWQAKFLKTPDDSKHLIIEAFINETWSYNASKVLPIGTEIMAACKAYGFDMEGSNVNPLLHFINEIYIPYNLTDKQYRTIHNATAGKLLKKEDFLKKGALGKGNLIFCKALYKLDAEVISGYLKKQANLLRASTKPEKFGTVADMAFSALYKIDLEKNIPKDVAALSSEELSLRTLDEISRLETEWLGKASDVSGEEVAPSSELVAKIIEAGKTTAINTIVALTLKFSSEAIIIETVKKCTDVEAALNKTMSPLEMIKLFDTTKKYIPKNITAKQALEIITGLIGSDELGLAKKE